MEKKLQIFVSSTFLDLIDERQSAVKAIIDAGHIPAGMELFKASNESQLETIKRWIDESDIFLLILGGRYGSIETKTGKSYTQLEYEYALEKNIPIFAVVLEEKWLHMKASTEGAEKIFQKCLDYDNFRMLVESKMVKYVEDLKDIMIAIHTTIKEFEKMYSFSGWVRGDSVYDQTKLLSENNNLMKENNKLQNQIDKLKTSERIGDFSFDEILFVLKEKEVTIEFEVGEISKTVTRKYLDAFLALRDTFATGITNQVGTKEMLREVYYKISPFLMNFGLLEKIKLTGVRYERIQLSKLGMKFLALYDLRMNNKDQI
ncbi:MAG: DUF4062 domain-containing protein [Lachnospiraceae bacterium]|nr:DUF4062 domain-containing protein [Lachnospiraceae bacterium]